MFQDRKCRCVIHIWVSPVHTLPISPFPSPSSPLSPPSLPRSPSIPLSHSPLCPPTLNFPGVPCVCIFTGDVSSGKSTLIDRLCQVSKSHPIGGKFPLSGCSLEYRFIDVQDEDTDGTCALPTTHIYPKKNYICSCIYMYMYIVALSVYTALLHCENALYCV